MVLLDQAVEETLLSGTPHRVKVKRLQLGKLGFDRALIQIRKAKRSSPMGQGIGRGKPFRGQLDVPCPMKRKHQPPAHHVPQRTVGLHPVPCLAEYFGKTAAAGTRMLGDQVSDKRCVCIRYDAASVFDFHGGRIAKRELERKFIILFFSPALRASNKAPL